VTSILNFSGKPSSYTLQITHHPDGTIEAWAHDVSDSPRSQDAVWFAVAQLATKHMKADQIHAAMLSRIDALMNCTDAADVAELMALAAACEAYEYRVFPPTDGKVTSTGTQTAENP